MMTLADSERDQFPCQNTLLCVCLAFILLLFRTAFPKLLSYWIKMYKEIPQEQPSQWISVAFAFIRSKTTIMRNRRGNSDLHHQVKMRSWEKKDNRKIFVFFSNLRRETHFGQMFQEWVWDAELECFLLTISNFISYLALWSRKSVLQHESFCHIPDLKWIKLLTFIVCCSFAIFCKCLFFFHLLSLSGITADSVSIYAHYQCREKEKWPLVISSLELIPV